MGSARVGQVGAENVYDIGTPNFGLKAFNLSTPAGWTLLYWAISVAIIFIVFLML